VGNPGRSPGVLFSFRVNVCISFGMPPLGIPDGVSPKLHHQLHHFV
jgi:hypothetical protein